VGSAKGCSLPVEILAINVTFRCEGLDCVREILQYAALRNFERLR